MKAFLKILATASLLGISNAQVIVTEETRDLASEATKIENNMFIQHSELEKRDPQIKILAEKAAAASAAAKQAVDKHPALAESRLKRDAAFAKLTVIMGKGTKGEDAEKRSAQEVYATANNELSQKARELPEIQTLTEASDAANAEYIKHREAFYAAQPETAQMAKQVSDLRTQALELKKGEN